MFSCDPFELAIFPEVQTAFELQKLLKPCIRIMTTTS